MNLARSPQIVDQFGRIHIIEKGDHKKAVGRLRGQFVTKTVSLLPFIDDRFEHGLTCF